MHKRDTPLIVAMGVWLWSMNVCGTADMHRVVHMQRERDETGFYDRHLSASQPQNMCPARVWVDESECHYTSHAAAELSKAVYAE